MCSKHDRRAHKQVAVHQEYGCFDEHTQTFVDDGLPSPSFAPDGPALQPGHKSGQQSEFRVDPSKPVHCADQPLPFMLAGGSAAAGSRVSRHAENWRTLYWRDMHCLDQCEPTEQNMIWTTLAQLAVLACMLTRWIGRRRDMQQSRHSSSYSPSTRSRKSSVGPESGSLLHSPPSSSLASSSSSPMSSSSSSPQFSPLAPDVLFLRHQLASLNAHSWVLVRLARTLYFVQVHGLCVLSFGASLLLRSALAVGLAALTYSCVLDALWMSDSHCRTFIWYAVVNDAIVFLAATTAVAWTIRHMQSGSTRTHDKNGN